MMNVLYLFVTYRLYLNCNARLTSERQVINYRHKILKLCYSNTDFLPENFLLEKSKELLKINLSFRTCLLSESFLLKLNRPWLCASDLVISTKTWRKTSIDDPAGTQSPESVPLWSYFGRYVQDRNKIKIGHFRFLTYIGSAMYGMHLASGNKIENNAVKMQFYKILNTDVLGTSQGRHPTDIFLGRFEDVRRTFLQNFKNKQGLTFIYFTQHIWWVGSKRIQQ